MRFARPTPHGRRPHHAATMHQLGRRTLSQSWMDQVGVDGGGGLILHNQDVVAPLLTYVSSVGSNKKLRLQSAKLALAGGRSEKLLGSLLLSAMAGR